MSFRCAASRYLQAGLMALGAILGGCAGGALPTTHYYTLAPPNDGSAGRAAGEAGLVIGIESFSVDAPYDQDRLVYRSSPDAVEVGFYNYHRWASPIGRLVQRGLVEGLAGVEGVAAVGPASSGGSYDARLGGRVLYLEQIERASDPVVRIGVALELKAPDELLWSDTVEAAVTGPMLDGADVALLHERAFAQLVDELRRRLAAVLAE